MMKLLRIIEFCFMLQLPLQRKSTSLIARGPRSLFSALKNFDFLTKLNKNIMQFLHVLSNQLRDAEMRFQNDKSGRWRHKKSFACVFWSKIVKNLVKYIRRRRKEELIPPVSECNHKENKLREVFVRNIIMELRWMLLLERTDNEVNRPAQGLPFGRDF